MADEEIRTRLGRTPPDVPILAPAVDEVYLRSSRRRRRRRVASAVAATVSLVAVGVPLWLLLGLRGPAPVPTVGTSPDATETRCVRARTSGDFDGDGTADTARFVEIASAGVPCEPRAELFEHVSAQELVITFGSDRTLVEPFDRCAPCLTGGGVFAATDLDGDGRDELAIDVGPGAALDFVGFYRVDTGAIDPLEVAAPGDPPYVEPGPAVLGGGFDSVLQSPVVCRVDADGTRELVSIHADDPGDPLAGRWNVHRTTLVLDDDRLVVVSSSDSKERVAIGSDLFDDRCR